MHKNSLKKWYQNFKTNLPNDYVAQVESFSSETVFKFGDGRRVKSKESVIFPVIIEDKKWKIKAEIVRKIYHYYPQRVR